MVQPDVTGLRSVFSGPHELVRTSDGKTLFLRRWDARPNSKASVLILHGITAYSGPYGPLIAEQLAQEGFEVYGMDLRGHGLSDGARGDYPSQERLESDLAETVAFVRGKSRKLVVLGHSLGALSAVVAERKCPDAIDGLILLSAAKKINAGAFGKPSAGAVLKSLVGATLLRGSPLIEYRRQGMLGLNDPLFNFRYSARFYSVLYGVGALRLTRMMRAGVLDSPNLEFEQKLRIPLLVGVGDHDELFAVDSVRQFCEGISADDKTFFVVPGARHAAFPKDSWGPVVSWLTEKF